MVNSLKEQTKRGKVSVKRRDNSANKRRENAGRDVKDSSHKEVLRCKLCGAKKSCPAFGKSFSVWGRMNHFASQCFTETRVNVLKSESESELDEYCLTLRSVNESEVIRVHVASDQEYARKLFATINVRTTPVKFQLDNGATCNLIPAKFLRAEVELFPTRKLLTMHNNTVMKPLGTSTVAVSNPKNSKTYQVEFAVVDDDQLTPILGNPTMQQMDLVRVQHQNVMAINTEVQRSSQCPLSMEEVLKEYPDVCQGNGNLKGQYKLEIEENAKPVVHPCYAAKCNNRRKM